MTRYEKIKRMGIVDIVSFIDSVRREPLIEYATIENIREWLGSEENISLFDIVGKPGRYLSRENTYSPARILSDESMFGQPYKKIAVNLGGEIKILTVPAINVL